MDCGDGDRHHGLRSRRTGAAMERALTANYAFENGRAEKQRAFGMRRWRRAAQRGR
jgi:hypothetical protein